MGTGVRMDAFATAINAIAGFSLGRTAFSEGSLHGMALQFDVAAIQPGCAQRFLTGALFISSALCIISFFVLLFSFDFIESLAFSAIFSSAAFGLFLLLPRLAAQKRISRCETELPFLLREFSVYLDVGISFEKALSKIASGRYELSREFSYAIQKMRSGASMQSSITAAFSQCPSIQVKRCVMLLFAIYETGSGTEPLKRTAEELSSTQLSSMRLLGGRISLLAILFVSSSALAPVFFSIYAAVAPFLAQDAVSASDVWVAFMVIFPLFNTIVLLSMWHSLPPLNKRSNERQTIPHAFHFCGLDMDARKFFSTVLLISAILSAFLYSLGYLEAAVLFISAAPLSYFLLQSVADSEISRSEELLSDALYSAGALHRLMPFEKMLQHLAEGKFGRLSSAFSLAARRIKAGDSVSHAMDAALGKCPSYLVGRAFSMLVICYETGANMSSAFRETAQDVASFFALVRERASIMAIQRYTVLAASALLVPFILGSTLSIVPAISSASYFSQGAQEVAGALPSACQAYLVLNALLSSFVLGISEGKTWKAAVYFVLIAPLSYLAFAFAFYGMPQPLSI